MNANSVDFLLCDHRTPREIATIFMPNPSGVYKLLTKTYIHRIHCVHLINFQTKDRLLEPGVSETKQKNKISNWMLSWFSWFQSTFEIVQWLQCARYEPCCKLIQYRSLSVILILGYFLPEIFYKIFAFALNVTVQFFFSFGFALRVK